MTPRPRFSRLLLLSALAVLCAGVGVLCLVGAGPTTAPRPGTGGAIAATAGAGGAVHAAGGLRHDFVPGRTLGYETWLDHQIEMDPAAMLGGDAAAGEPRRMRLGLRGHVEQTVVSAGDDEVILWVHLPRATITGVAGDERDQAALARGALVRLDPSGRVLALRLPGGTPRVAAGLLEYLSGVLQVGLPAAGAGAAAAAAAEWQHEERAQDGWSVVRYRVEPGDGAAGPTLHKTPLASTRSALVASERAERAKLVAHPGGELVITFDARAGRATRFEGELRLDVEASVEARRVIGARGRLRAALVEIREGEAAPGADDWGGWIALGEPRPPSAASVRDELEASVAGLTWADLGAELAGAAALERPARLALSQRLSAYLQLHPEAAADAARALGALDPGAIDAQLLASALAQAGHPDAQAALRQGLDAWRDAGRETHGALALLGQLDAPDAATTDYLASLTHDADADTASAAELALGSAAGHLADDDPARASAIARRYADELAAQPPPSPARTQALLSVLGNAGSVEVLPAARRLLAGADARLRGAAALALRFVPGAEADALLAAVILGETDSDALVMSLVAVRYRAPSLATTAALRTRAAGPLEARVAGLVQQLLARVDAA